MASIPSDEVSKKRSRQRKRPIAAAREAPSRSVHLGRPDPRRVRAPRPRSCPRQQRQLRLLPGLRARSAGPLAAPLPRSARRLLLRRPSAGLRRSRAAVAALVNAGDVSEISLVDNATTAAAIVLQHAAWSFAEGHFARGDAVLMLHYAYGAVKKSIQAYVARAGATVVEVPLPFPVTSPHAIIAEFHAALAVAKAGGRKVRLAVIDHITSMPSVLIPVKELVAICRQEGVDKVFVDAAHSVGQVPVDVRDIGADFYTSNLHKWFFCPPAVAFLHTRKGGHSFSAPPPCRVT
ncbi:putative L-cysteine desulfhydrase 1 [Hordeum vulgare]|nr:putative L-cysteine desulfhydrase 1 [Hordeum vulgare]